MGTDEGLDDRDMYDYDAEAIFRKLTGRHLSGGEDFLDEFVYKKWIRSVLAPSGSVRFSTGIRVMSLM